MCHSILYSEVFCIRKLRDNGDLKYPGNTKAKFGGDLFMKREFPYLRLY